MTLQLSHSPGACSLAPHICFERMMERPAVRRAFAAEGLRID